MSKDMILFLQEIKSTFSYDKPLTIVMGNEAADLDSMASALTYAWYLYLSDPSSNPYPLINIPKDDFKLRTEAVYLFKEAGVNIDQLLFAEDLDLLRLKESGKLKLILVDHNKIGSDQEELNNSVVGIIDHHADEKSYPPDANADIRPVGSAATMVAELILKNQKKSLEKSSGTLLLGTILLDTVNLDPAAGRVTDSDLEAARAIIKMTGLDQKKLFDKLQFEKFNVSSLGSYDLLRKDYKEWQLGSVKCGIAAVLQPIEKWVQKDPAIAKECERYLKERNLDVLFGMNAFTAPEFTRQLVVYIPEKELRSRTIAFLESASMGLEKLDLGVAGIAVYYNQKNLGISRKKLQPLLKDFFEK